MEGAESQCMNEQVSNLDYMEFQVLVVVRLCVIIIGSPYLDTCFTIWTWILLDGLDQKYRTRFHDPAKPRSG